LFHSISPFLTGIVLRYDRMIMHVASLSITSRHLLVAGNYNIIRPLLSSFITCIPDIIGVLIKVMNISLIILPDKKCLLLFYNVE